MKAISKQISNQNGNTKNYIIVLLALLINAVVIGGGGIYIWRQKAQADKEKLVQDAIVNPKSVDSAKVEENKSEFKKIIPFESVLTSLHGDNGRRMIRVGLQVQLEGNEVMNDVATLKPQLRDAIIVAVGDFEASDADRPEGKEMLKKNILAAMNKILKKGKATDLFFTEFETN